MNPEELTIEGLRRWSQILLWIAVLLPVLGAIAVGARYYVERYEKQLSSRMTSAAIIRAHEQASSARSDLIQLRAKIAPRAMSEEQRRAMLPLIESIKGRPVAFACRMMDGESCDFGNELARFFLSAGCQVPEQIKTSLNDLPGYLAITAHGAADQQVAYSVLAAFKAAGIDARIEVVPQNSVGGWYNDVVHVVVGRKAT
jgi:hypothetical protein